MPRSAGLVGPAVPLALAALLGLVGPAVLLAPVLLLGLVGPAVLLAPVLLLGLVGPAVLLAPVGRQRIQRTMTPSKPAICGSSGTRPQTSEM